MGGLDQRRRTAGGTEAPEDEGEVTAAVERTLLGLALANAARSVPLQLLASGLVAWLAWEAGQSGTAVAVAVLATVVAASRLLMVRVPLGPSAHDRQRRRVTHWMEATAAVAGVAWGLPTALVYPALPAPLGPVYLVLAVGAVAVAGFFMPLAGRAFVLYGLCHLAGFAWVVRDASHPATWPLTAAVLVFLLTVGHAAASLRRLTADAIAAQRRGDQALHELLRAKEAAEAAAAAKAQFLATMSHEIRTPMNGVLGSLDALRASALGVEQRAWADTAVASGRSLMAILNDVLDHTQLEAGQMRLAPQAMSLAAVAEAALRVFRANADAKGLALRQVCALDAGEWVQADPQRLEQVLLNLVGNAVKFTPQGTVVLEVRSSPLEPGRVRVEIAVADTGVGIDAELRTGLLEPFHQGPDARRRGSTGLGLAISQRIVQAMGGTIQVTSRPGEGSRFFFALELPQAAAVVAAEPAAAPSPAPARRGLALVVDDDAVNRLVAAHLLGQAGFAVEEAINGEQALQMAEAHPPDVILMDCEMPVLDGCAATERLRTRERERGLRRTPVIAITAYAFEQDVQRVFAAGMDAHLAKPFGAAQLHAALAAVMPPGAAQPSDTGPTSPAPA